MFIIKTNVQMNISKDEIFNMVNDFQWTSCLEEFESIEEIPMELISFILYNNPDYLGDVYVDKYFQEVESIIKI